MDDTQKIVINQRQGKRQSREDAVLHRGEMSMFSERMAGLVGPSYVLAFIAGGFIGLTKTPPLKARRTKRLLVNSYVNNIGKTSFRYANNTGAAVLMYMLTGKLINFVFLEEFEDLHVNETVKNAVYGGFAGAVYKSTRGFRPMMLSAILGASIGSGYAVAWQKGMFKLL